MNHGGPVTDAAPAPLETKYRGDIGGKLISPGFTDAYSPMAKQQIMSHTDWPKQQECSSVVCRPQSAHNQPETQMVPMQC